MNKNMKNMEKAAMKSLPRMSRKREMMLTVATRSALLSSRANASFMAGQKLFPFIATTINAFLSNNDHRDVSLPTPESASPIIADNVLVEELEALLKTPEAALEAHHGDLNDCVSLLGCAQLVIDVLEGKSSELHNRNQQTAEC